MTDREDHWAELLRRVEPRTEPARTIRPIDEPGVRRVGEDITVRPNPDPNWVNVWDAQDPHGEGVTVPLADVPALITALRATYNELRAKP